MAKILIVDDSEVLRMELRSTLESAGHEVIEGCDGVDGIAKANANLDIQLLISDVNMPEMDGVTMVKHIKQQAEFAKLPVFMLTTESSPELKVSGKEAGVMLWVIKPFNKEKIVGAIQKVLA
jgi:two-component system, chemotaxis family, chemotaxis protein CheY